MASNGEARGSDAGRRLLRMAALNSVTVALDITKTAVESDAIEFGRDTTIPDAGTFGGATATPNTGNGGSTDPTPRPSQTVGQTGTSGYARASNPYNPGGFHLGRSGGRSNRGRGRGGRGHPGRGPYGGVSKASAEKNHRSIPNSSVGSATNNEATINGAAPSSSQQRGPIAGDPALSRTIQAGGPQELAMAVDQVNLNTGGDTMLDTLRPVGYSDRRGAEHQRRARSVRISAEDSARIRNATL
ncbi:hypothetical protein FSPOR_621 [Fusarium sporotrichioides]|uniref:Uncharacterized protein n=1 Tax=Fusarium sporotrichioides TaxID=5514 RepID=A0A395SSU1_FUSSP|nr:hypothetical protein FSPOR_621 [Fusarium sporotrichioides]